MSQVKEYESLERSFIFSTVKVNEANKPSNEKTEIIPKRILSYLKIFIVYFSTIAIKFILDSSTWCILKNKF